MDWQPVLYSFVQISSCGVTTNFESGNGFCVGGFSGGVLFHIYWEEIEGKRGQLWEIFMTEEYFKKD